MYVTVKSSKASVDNISIQLKKYANVPTLIISRHLLLLLFFITKALQSKDNSMTENCNIISIRFFSGPGSGICLVTMIPQSQVLPRATAIIPTRGEVGRAGAGHNDPSDHLLTSMLLLILKTSWRYFARSLSFCRFFPALISL